MTELKDRYTKSCRDLVAQSRKSPNPRPGPIPARLPIAGVIARQRMQSACYSRVSLAGDRNNQQAQTVQSPSSTIKVNTLFHMSSKSVTPANLKEGGDAQTQKLPSTFTRTRLKRGRQTDGVCDYEEFNTLGVFNHQREDDSPTELKMKRTALLLNQNKSFDQYFVEMRRRNNSKGITINHLGQRFLMSEAQTNQDDRSQNASF